MALALMVWASNQCRLELRLPIIPRVSSPDRGLKSWLYFGSQRSPWADRGLLRVVLCAFLLFCVRNNQPLCLDEPPRAQLQSLQIGTPSEE